MICPKCSANHPRKKSGMTCSCGYKFVFDPAVDKITDHHFLNLVNRASANDTYYFTLPQLEGRRVRGLRKSPRKRLLWTVLLGAASGACFAAGFTPGGFVFGGLAAIAAVMFLSALGPSALPARTMPAAVAKWRGSHGELARLIDQPTLSQPPPDYVEADIYAYGAEKVLIVNRNLLVDLFVRNGFHAQERVLILSEDGYPGYLQKVANDILAQHPETPVFLLHDAASSGTSMHDRLVGGGKLNIASNRVIDLGLSPHDVERLFGFKVAGDFYLDMLPYRALSNLLAHAMAQGIPFSRLPKKEIEKYDESTGSSFG